MISRLAKHIRPLKIRDGSEPHRAATQLELMFDLVVVIALATAAHELRHGY
jgi:low temperature requirement protein LtrA